MVVRSKNQRLRWDGNGEKSAFADYKEKDVKWEQELNNLIYIMSIEIGDIDDLKAKVKKVFNKVLDKEMKDMYTKKSNNNIKIY